MKTILKSLDIANLFIEKYGKSAFLTNLKLNKLVYFAQVEALREDGLVLFDDDIEAWGYGPVEPSVYHNFSYYGRSRIQDPSIFFGKKITEDERAIRIVEKTWKNYGFLTAYDLVTYSHRSGSAWCSVFDEKKDMKITAQTILKSKDFSERPRIERTLAGGIESVDKSFPNALNLLKDA
jgi:uncharacterized phage-associated protein